VFPNFWPPVSGLKTPGSAWMSSFLAVALALLLPALLLLGGFAIDLMGWEHQRVEQSTITDSSSSPVDSLSQYASIGPFRWKLSTTPIVGALSAPQMALGAIALLGVGLVLMSVMHWLQRRSAALGALDTEEQLHQRLFHHSGALAVERGLSAQSELLRTFYDQSFPLTRSAIVQWLQVYPRHFLQIALLLLLAGLIHP